MASLPANGRLALRHRLALRVGLALCLGVAAIFVALGIYNVRTQREHMIGLSRKAADRVSALIRGATRDGMLRNELGQVDRILRSIGTAPGIDRIRILDREGKVHSSTDVRDVGRTIPDTEFQCKACHRGGAPLERPADDQRIRLIEGEAGRRVIDVIAPIYNEPACSTGECHAHPVGQKVLGVIDVQMPMRPVDDLIGTSERQLAVGLVVTLVLIVLLTGFLTWHLVVKPVQRLAGAADRVAGGDLSARVPADSPDELGRMAQTWNTMVGELAKARGELEDWSHTLEERVEAKTAELESAHQRMLVVEKMASLGKLAAVVAHEINNPLAGIGTYAKLLRRKLEADGSAEGPKAEEAGILDLMESESARCGQIVRNLLLFSRTPGARFAEAEMAAIVERCRMLVNHQAELQGVEFHADIPADLPLLVCDASQVQQVVLALFMNALDAMPGGGNLTARARHEPGPDEIVLEVEDDGCGIPADSLDHVFEPFFTTKEQGEGVGLGLSVVYGIVQRHRGQVDVRSKPGLGTVFRVRLPRAQAQAGESPAAEELAS
jgi:two-component system NtrC family sensor kinase